MTSVRVGSTRVGSTRVRRAAWVAFVLALVLQLVALYWPSPPGGPGIPGLDKLVHATIFILPAALGVVAGVRPLWLGIALFAHAVASELVQQLVLPERSGDVWDAVADVIGVAVGLALGIVLRRCTASAQPHARARNLDRYARRWAAPDRTSAPTEFL